MPCCNCTTKSQVEQLRKIKLTKMLVRIILASFLISTACFAQESEIVTILVNETIPDITFERIHYSPEGSFSSKNLKGKPTILYFFSTACATSFKKLPKISDLNKRFSGRVRMLMVGLDLDDDIQGNYEAYRKKYLLDLPITYDQVIYKKYWIRAVPTVIWITKQGIVQAITNTVDETQLEAFARGETFNHIDYSAKGKDILRNFNPDRDFFAAGKTYTDPSSIQKSVLMRWRAGLPNYIPHEELYESPLKDVKYLQLIGRDLAGLYRLAYFNKTSLWGPMDTIAYGKYHYSPVLEIKDASPFNSDYDLGENLFCYSQILPKEKRSEENMIRVMQNDLENFFSYKATVETRLMPYLSLTCSPGAKHRLQSKTTQHTLKVDMKSLKATNISISELIQVIIYYNGLVARDLPLLDETGIEGTIDISIDAILTDLHEVKLALNRAGFKVVKKKKLMKVIVIKDSPLKMPMQ